MNNKNKYFVGNEHSMNGLTMLEGRGCFALVNKFENFAGICWQSLTKATAIL